MRMLAVSDLRIITLHSDAIQPAVEYSVTIMSLQCLMYFPDAFKISRRNIASESHFGALTSSRLQVKFSNFCFSIICKPITLVTGGFIAGLHLRHQ